MIKIKLINNDCKPIKSTSGSIAYDLFANIDQEIAMYPNDIIPVPLGIAIDTSNTDYAGLLLPRSGLSSNCGITLANGMGLIDDDYHVEIIAKLINKSKNKFTVKPLMRICQLLFSLVCKHDSHVKFVDELEQNERKGFGSTGL